MKKLKPLFLSLFLCTFFFTAKSQYVSSIDAFHTSVNGAFSPFDTVLVKVDLTLNSLDLLETITLKYGTDTLDSENTNWTFTHIIKNEMDYLVNSANYYYPIVDNKVTLPFTLAQQKFKNSGFLQVISSNLEPCLRRFVLNGFVRDANYRNIRNNTISLFRLAGTTYEFDHSIEADSNFSILAEKAGKYLILVKSDTTINNKSYLPTYYNSAADWHNATQVNLAPHIINPLLIVYLITEATPTNSTWNTGDAVISGTLTLGSENLRISRLATAEKAIVYLVSETGEKLAHYVTDESGKFEFTHIAEGTYTIQVAYPGTEPFVQTVVTSGTIEDTKVVSASLKPVVITGVNNFTISNKLTIFQLENEHIQVVMPEGKKLNGVKIYTTTGQQINTINYIKTGNELNFSTSLLPAGIYVVVVETDNNSSVGKFIK